MMDVVIDDADQGGEAACWAHLTDELDLRQPSSDAPPSVLGSNTIIYCDRWADVVDFYRTGLGLRTSMERDWFVELELHPGAHVSIADASRATIVAGDGTGLTLSWRVADLDAERDRLRGNGVDVSSVRSRWGARAFFVLDPVGNRIEFWSAETSS